MGDGSLRCSLTCQSLYLSVTYGVAKVMVKVFKPLVGKLPHHIQSTSDFVSKVREVTLLPGECLSSYDVTALFTSVPIDPALHIIKDLLEQDDTLCTRTVLSVQNIIGLLGFCLHNTYFSFWNKFYEQVEGVAMGSPVSPIVANLYMKHFKREALRSASHLPRFWYRFVDDTWVIQQQAHKQLFLDHINSIDPAIKFTVEGNQENGAIPFLDTLVKPEADNSLSIKVYCKPTHTDQYLQWDSHHNLSARYSVIGKLTHRAKTVCTTLDLLNEELQHLKEALVRCKYPKGAINKVQNKDINGNWEENGNNSTDVDNTTWGTKTSSDSNQTTTPVEDTVWDTWSFHMFRAWGKALNTFASNMVYRPNLKETGPSSSFW